MKTVAFLLGLLVAVVIAAEVVGLRREMYAGGASGFLMGLVGLAFGAKIVARHRKAKAAKDGRWDIWTLWGAGMLARLALLGLTVPIFLALPQFEMPAAMLTLAAVYVVMLFWEAGWLYFELIDDGQQKD